MGHAADDRDGPTSEPHLSPLTLSTRLLSNAKKPSLSLGNLISIVSNLVGRDPAFLALSKASFGIKDSRGESITKRNSKSREE